LGQRALSDLDAGVFEGYVDVSAMQCSDPRPDLIRFSDFVADIRAGKLQRRGRKVSLREQPFEVLALLLERPGEVVTREELRRRLWPDGVFVDFDNNLNTAVGRLREALGDSAEHPRFIETLPKRGYRFIADVTRPAAGKTPARRVKLAVLPFANLSGDPAQEYFSDGITEELISRLAELAPEHLGVIARTTAMHYKGGRKAIAEIGRDLSLDYVLEGSARREGDQARVTVQLIRASDQTHVWSKSYDFELRHILSLQSELADAVAERIKVILPLGGRPDRVRAVDPEAHDACLKGLYQFSRYNPVAFEHATECFQLAVRKDPGYSAAYAKLALCHGFAGYFGYAMPSDAYPQAETAAVKALEIDGTLAEAHLALGLVRFFHNWDLAACEREFQRAIELSPNDPTARWSHAMFIASMKENHSAAAAEMALAQELDPLSMSIRANTGWILYWARNFDRAILYARETIGLDENCVQACQVLGLSLIATGAPDEAVVVLEEAVRRFGDPLSLAWLGMALGAADRRDEAHTLLRLLEEKSASGRMPSLCLAWVHVGLGAKAAALDLIEKAYDEHDAVILWLRVSPTFDTLRDEPRYRQMLVRLNLPPPVRA
jgi:TolB-like protein/Flp pilus assembly protein TadD